MFPLRSAPYLVFWGPPECCWIVGIDKGELQTVSLENWLLTYTAGALVEARVIHHLPAEKAVIVEFESHQALWSCAKQKALPKIGQLVRLQIEREPIWDKGQRDKSYRMKQLWTLESSYIVYSDPILENMPSLQFSQTWQESFLCEKIKNILLPFLQMGEKVLLRSQLRHYDLDQIIDIAKYDIDSLRNEWRKVSVRPSLARTGLIHAGRRQVSDQIRMYPTSPEIFVQNSTTFEYLQQHFPKDCGAITSWTLTPPDIKEFDWPETHSDLLSPEVDLPNGGSFVIEETAVGTMIDVNSQGLRSAHFRSSTHQINMAAARAISQHIQWRQLEGRIWVDFINLSHHKDVKGFLRQWQSSLPPFVRLFPSLTRLGLVELVIPKKYGTLSQRFEQWKDFIEKS